MDLFIGLNYQPIMCAAYNTHVFCDMPNNLTEIPQIDDSLINKKYTSICSSEYIREYFESLCDNDLKVFNGIRLNSCPGNYCCDYCSSFVTNKYFYYCSHCYKNIYMCVFCYEEVNEEIAIKNGAKLYKQREPFLNECIKHNQFHLRNMTNVSYDDDRICDLCNDPIDNYETRFANDDDFDMCMKCYTDRDDSKDTIKALKLNFIDKTSKEYFAFNCTDFNSMLYWIPIVKDNSGCHILINLNPDDKNYGKLCLHSVDNYYNHGYFIIYNETITLEILLKKLKDIADKGTYEYTTFKTIEKSVYEENKLVKEPITKEMLINLEIGYHRNTSAIQLLMKNEFNMKVVYN
jgi:hypothetical protein